MREPSDSDLWRCVDRTIRDVLLPAVGDEWARVVAIQLVGLARYASTRPADPLPAQVIELADALDRLSANPIVAARWPGRNVAPAAVLEAVSGVLADAVARDDTAGDEARAELRPLVMRHLDEELAVTGVMMPYFRGQLPDA